jgi:hypothetical protein
MCAMDTIRKVDYFSIVVPDRPGQTFRVLQTLVSAGINLIACNGFPRGRRAQIDVVPDDSRKFNSATKKAGLAFEPKKSGFLIQGKDRPGALAGHLDKLATADINVTAIEALTPGGGRWAAILWVKSADLGRAARALRARSK